MELFSGHKGLVHAYYGDGKGKTTASLGQILRSVGNDMGVVLVQFFKSDDTGELRSLHQLGVKVFRGRATKGFSLSLTEEEKEKTRALHNSNLKQAWTEVESGKIQLLVLDEGLDAYAMELIDTAFFNEIILNKPDHLEIVVTGHSLPDFFTEHANYVTKMEKIKHPYDEGIAFRKGVEY